MREEQSKPKAKVANTISPKSMSALLGRSHCCSTGPSDESAASRDFGLNCWRKPCLVVALDLLLPQLIHGIGRGGDSSSFIGVMC